MIRLKDIILRMRSFSYNLFMQKILSKTFRANEKVNDLKLSLENRRNFYLFFKEATTNLVKHSGASKVEINLRYENSFY